jgi:hypothetical protein
MGLWVKFQRPDMLLDWVLFLTYPNLFEIKGCNFIFLKIITGVSAEQYAAVVQ